MATSYPTELPAVPADRWGITRAGHGGDIDDGTTWTEFTLSAGSEHDAELRVLAHLDFDFEDDLRGAIATARRDGSRFTVRVTHPR